MEAIIDGIAKDANADGFELIFGMTLIDYMLQFTGQPQDQIKSLIGSTSTAPQNLPML
jgi:hypothetical protein